MRRIAVIGLGYAGLYTALGLGKRKKVIGYDINKTRIKELQEHVDKNGNFTPENFINTQIEFTSNPERLKEADFYIVIVPTPVNSAKEPDFKPLVLSSELVGKYLKRGDIVVYESTVYPGATEEICAPTLEKVSSLQVGKDFSLGYSPERINPGDKLHHFEDTVKIVAGSDPSALEIIAKEYEEVIAAGIYRVSCIKVAEAAKVIENTQRDLNIAFVNEIAMLLHKLGLDTSEVLSAALTKWNFLPFKPGFVGGHCISVDPYYLIHKAIELNYDPKLMMAAREVNEHVPHFIAEGTIKFIINHRHLDKKSVIGILGITYKEDCPDVRNSLVVNLIKELQNYGLNIKVYDPVAKADEVYKEYGLRLVKWSELSELTAIVIAVAHEEFKQLSKEKYLEKLCENGVIIDVKSVLPQKEFESSGINVWRL